jgi:hypothetical protein
MIIDAAVREIMGEATRAGITKESFGQWHYLARRNEESGNTEAEIHCLRKCLEIQEVWGSRLPNIYDAGPDTVARVTNRLKELTA